MTQSIKHGKVIIAWYTASLSVQPKTDREEALNRAVEVGTIATPADMKLCRDLIAYFEENPKKARFILDAMRNK